MRSLGDPEPTFRILIADRDSMSSDLLANALARYTSFQAAGVHAADLLDSMASGKAHLVVIGAELNHNSRNGFELARMVSRAHSAIPIVILLNESSHDSVTEAFRSGARGVFSRQQPLADLHDCVGYVRKGFIWAGIRETTLLLDALSSVHSPNMYTASEPSPLTMRERQVVRWAARGKTNKLIASELGLSEHTVKNYLFRAFPRKNTRWDAGSISVGVCRVHERDWR